MAIPPQKLMEKPRSLLVSLFLLATLASAFSPADNHLLNCGSSADPTTVDNRLFSPDAIAHSASASASASFRLSDAASVSLRDDNRSRQSSPLYQTARIFTGPASYEFDIKEKGIHFVRLHFSPFSSPKFNLSAARFSVSVLDYLLLKDFIVPNDSPVVKEFIINIDAEKFKLSFIPSCMSSSFAFINAIEVISAPKDLILDVGRSIDSGGIENVDGLLKQGFETVYRLNVGGSKLTPFNDTLWRTWNSDERYLKLVDSAKVVSFSGRIQYQKGGASQEVAPDNVYRTARVMNSENVSFPNFNITWILPVEIGYKYLVRVHFCDIVSLAVNELYFNVYVNGYMAYKNLDLSAVDITNQRLASPYYVDFIVYPMSSGNIHVSIGPSKLSDNSNINAILNGLEILKMNNSMGSFNGAFSVASVMSNTPKGKMGAWVCSVVGGFGFMSMLVAGFMVLSKRRMGMKDSVAWSPLPVEDNLKYGPSPLSACEIGTAAAA